MPPRKKQMSLGVLVNANGPHLGAWRMPEATPQDSFNLSHYKKIATIAERGLLDFLFLADTMAVEQEAEGFLGRTPPVAHFEPFTLLSALATCTTHIGLAGSATTTYFPPYLVARILASLDLISEGRAAWNVVTSANPEEAYNFGFESHPDKSNRYERAAEFVDVVLGLWKSCPNGTFPFDKVTGQYFDPSKFSVLNHSGEHFKVKGPLLMPRSPQGRPVIAQAGASDVGRDLASRVGEVIFTVQQNLDGAKAFYADMQRRLSDAGRSPEDLVILPGMVTIVGRTDEEARDKYEQLQSAFDPLVGLSRLSIDFGIDLTVYPLDEPLPHTLPPGKFALSRRDMLIEEAARNGWTVRQLAREASRGFKVLHGSPITIADTLQAWHEAGAADGYILMPAPMVTQLEAFVDQVIPELQHRNLFRTGYESSTLRGNLGLRVQ